MEISVFFFGIEIGFVFGIVVPSGTDRVVHPREPSASCPPDFYLTIFSLSYSIGSTTLLFCNKTSGSTAWRNVGGTSSATDGHVFEEAEGADFQRDRERAGDGAVQPGSVSALTRHGI